MWVQPLGWEDPLEEGRAAHSSILAWRIPWTEEPGRLQSAALKRVKTEVTEHTQMHMGHKCGKNYFKAASEAFFLCCIKYALNNNIHYFYVAKDKDHFLIIILVL